MDKFNYSAVSTSRKCNKLYQYAYVDKLKADVQPSGDLAFGTAMHMALQAYIEGDDGVPQFELFWQLEKANKNEYGRYGHEDLLDQGVKLLERFERLHLSKFKAFHVEKTLEHSVDDTTMIYGTPDFIGEFNGQKCILDFKTSARAYSKDQARVSEQMWLYAYLAQKVLGYTPEVLVYFVFVKNDTPSIQTPVIVKFNQETCDLVFKEFVETVKDLKSRKNFTRNLASCIIGQNKCPYFNNCHGGEK